MKLGLIELIELQCMGFCNLVGLYSLHWKHEVQWNGFNCTNIAETLVKYSMIRYEIHLKMNRFSFWISIKILFCNYNLLDVLVFKLAPIEYSSHVLYSEFASYSILQYLLT